MVYALFILLFSLNCLFGGEKYVIGTNGIQEGLFSNFINVLNGLDYCDKNNLTPVVSWGNGATCTYFTPEGYNGSFNAWEYYFEPVSYLPWNQEDPISKKSYRYNIPLSFSTTYVQENKMWIHALIKKYIKVKPVIQRKVDDFYREHMEGQRTIGIHLRGTDRLRLESDVHAQILEEANKYEDCQFFIATDQQELFDKALESLKGPIIYYPALRSQNGKPLHLGKLEDKAVRGEEVLIEMLLLSRCSTLIHSSQSLVSNTVYYFNPEIEGVCMKANPARNFGIKNIRIK